MQAMGSGCGIMELWDGEQWLCSNVGEERLHGQWPAMAKAS